MGDTAQTNHDSQLGRMVVERQLASEQEVQAAMDLLKQQAERDGQTDVDQERLGAMLVAQGYVTESQLKRLRSLLEEPRPSQKIPGFELKRKLGAGAMATTYLARQVSLDRMVAIKILPKKYTNSREYIERFYAEGRAAAKLNHPNVVGALDVGRAGDMHYFVMEYVEGHMLHDDITAGKKFSEKQVLDIIIQVARGLEHAHNAGFIHRDVKPKNIMISNDGVVKIVDMGLARAVSDREAAESEQGKAYGTPYYISPEQIRGEVDVDFRADIYSLGATFYHVVTGRVPFEGANPSAVMHKHLKAKLTPPDQINPDISAGIAEIIEVCMAKDRARRYASTADLLQDLESVARGDAPLQARQMFDLAALTGIEPEDEPLDADVTDRRPIGTDQSPLIHILIWAAVAGWCLAFITLLVLIITRG